MTDFPDIKIKTLISFPASILDGIGIDVVKQGGSYQFNLGYGDFAPPVALIPDPANQTVLLWNAVSKQFVLSQLSLVGGILQGTFAPVLTFGGASVGVTYSLQNGRYTKIGNLVFIAAELVLTSKGSSVGTMMVVGLPLPVSASISPAFTVRANNLAAAAITDLHGMFNINGANFTRYAAGVASPLADTDFTNTTNLRFSGFYYVD